MPAFRRRVRTCCKRACGPSDGQSVRRSSEAYAGSASTPAVKTACGGKGVRACEGVCGGGARWVDGWPAWSSCRSVAKSVGSPGSVAGCPSGVCEGVVEMVDAECFTTRGGKGRSVNIGRDISHGLVRRRRADGGGVCMAMSAEKSVETSVDESESGRLGGVRARLEREGEWRGASNRFFREVAGGGSNEWPDGYIGDGYIGDGSMACSNEGSKDASEELSMVASRVLSSERRGEMDGRMDWSVGRPCGCSAHGRSVMRMTTGRPGCVVRVGVGGSEVKCMARMDLAGDWAVWLTGRCTCGYQINTSRWLVDTDSGWLSLFVNADCGRGGV